MNNCEESIFCKSDVAQAQSKHLKGQLEPSVRQGMLGPKGQLEPPSINYKRSGSDSKRDCHFLSGFLSLLGPVYGSIFKVKESIFVELI